MIQSVGNPVGETTSLVLTVGEAARRLGIGRTLMYSLVSSGQIESICIGRLRRIPSECLTEYVNHLRTAAVKQTSIAA